MEFLRTELIGFYFLSISFIDILDILLVSFIFYREPQLLGLVVGISIFGSMAMSAMLGTVIPLVLKRFDFDAAIATGPFVTTSIDIVGVMMYFYIAKIILGL